ncbi:MAG: hypothetical protein HY028_01060 [Gammaproteobacteria bacterium]|nr:hypothetical protein [Gammaproteobacteria bacterium]
MMAASRTEYGTGLRLSTLLEGYAPVSPTDEREILGLSLDSRRTRPGDLFLAQQGGARHGAEFIEDAARAGAVAVAVESNAATPTAHHAVPVYDIVALGQKIGHIAARFYGHPSHNLTVIGVTGTNGKTSVTHFLAQALSDTVRREESGVTVRREESGVTVRREPLTPHRPKAPHPSPLTPHRPKACAASSAPWGAGCMVAWRVVAIPLLMRLRCRPCLRNCTNAARRMW